MKYDGIVQKSNTANGSLRPVWNQYVYFPLYMPNPAVMETEHLVKTVLPIDMKVRGPLEIEVWHWNGTSTSDMLGRCMFDTANITR